MSPTSLSVVEAHKASAWADIDSTSDIICAACVRVGGTEIVLAGEENCCA
jgi:hypothetical protein